MSQRARPDADVANDGWTPTPLFAQLDEPVPDDGTQIASPDLPPASTFRVHLTERAVPIAGPPVDGTAVPPHRLTVRMQGPCTSAAVVTLIDRLHGADRVVASRGFKLTPEFVDYELVLTRQEAARIEDYTTLEVRVTASSGGSTSCAWLADLPDGSNPDIPPPCFLLKLLGGKGRCECIDVDETGDDSGLLMAYVPALSGWLGVARLDADGNVVTGGSALVDLCCGCGSAFLTIDQDALTATLTIGGVHTSCAGGGSSGGSGSGSSGGSAAVFTLDLVQECCGVDPITARPYVSFFGKGPDACSGDRAPCDNTFHVRVECGLPCPQVGCGCVGCASDPAPVAWFNSLSGFSDERLDGNWVWARSENCTWVATCKGQTSTLTFVPGDTPKWRLTHGASVFEASFGENNCAASGMTLSRVSGDGPDTITLTPVVLPNAASCCSGVDLSRFPDSFTVSVTAPGCPVFDGASVTVTKTAPGQWQYTNPEIGCSDCIVTAIVYCFGGTFKVSLTGNCTPGTNPIGVTATGFPTGTYSLDPFALSWVDAVVDGSVIGDCCTARSDAVVSLSL
ncbi:MAG TPA: hypothetical protein VH092_37885 [Urbifossiella sp.]|nr:hypothetical protein [Urbifossiella sp.]